MNKPVKQKLCWNCEGSVATHTENCQYCGVYLSPNQQEEFNFSLLKAPYSIQEEDNTTKVLKAPYSPEESTKVDTSPQEKKILKVTAFSMESVLALLGLTTGVVFALFALALFLFSVDGVLTLQWNADYWYIYAIIAVPAMSFGWYYLQKIKEAKEEG